ncbi:MAG: folate-binding protein [Baekduia sp.]
MTHPAATYASVTSHGAGLLPPREDGKLLISGTDAAQLLDGQLSNDVAGLDQGSGCAAALLTGKGRMLAPVRVLRRADGYLLLTERATLQTVFDRLRSGALGWDAEIGKLTLELARIELIGPASEAVAATAGYSVPGPAVHACTDDSVRTEDGIELLVPAAAESDARERLRAAGALDATRELAEIVRIEAGRPRWGAELDEQTMPEEAGIVDQLVSFTKGCYVGQETVARLHWKGRPNRRLRLLQLNEPAEAGAAVLSADGERELGAVSSAALSPEHGPLALAMLRREAEPGDNVLAGGVSAIVAAAPVPRTGTV